MPFKVEVEFSLHNTNLTISLQASTEYGLITVGTEYVESSQIGDDHKLHLTENSHYLYVYVKKGLKPTLEIYEFFNGSPFEKLIEVKAYVHYHFFLKLTEGEVSYIELALGPFEYYEEYFEVGNNNRVYDASGNAYKVVKIGEQYWMAENLKATNFCNGEEIPEEMAPFLMEQYFDQSMSAVVLTSANLYPVCGYYTVYAVKDQRNICPCGWHVATDEDWKELESYLGMPVNELDSFEEDRGKEQNLGGKLKATDWRDLRNPLSPGFNNDATNITGFSAYPLEEMIFWDVVDPDDPDSPGYWVIEGDNNAIWWVPGNGLYPIMKRAINPSFSSSAEESSSTGIARKLSSMKSTNLLPVRCVSIPAMLGQCFRRILGHGFRESLGHFPSAIIGLKFNCPTSFC
ncbi:fibrobacter succinogenes major paralogous domain-containing protein, partial [Echinicola jeungdonensis]